MLVEHMCLMANPAGCMAQERARCLSLVGGTTAGRCAAHFEWVRAWRCKAGWRCSSATHARAHDLRFYAGVPVQ